MRSRGTQNAAMIDSQPMSHQLTIQRPVETEGIGLHTAVRCRMRLVPAPADTGIVFRRVDLDNFEIEAHVRNVARVSYATSLMKQGVLLSTTEHVLAALYSCGVTTSTSKSMLLNCPSWTVPRNPSSSFSIAPASGACAADGVTFTS